MVTMKKLKLFSILFLMMLVGSVLGADLKDHISIDKTSFESHLESLNTDTKTPIEVTAFKVASSSDYNTKISKDGSSVSFEGLKEPDKISRFDIKTDSKFASKILDVENANMTKATVVLEKTSQSIGKYNILHSIDGINYKEVDIPYEHNYTHIWFNVTHFSSWTTSLDSPYILYETVYQTIDLEDYANIDSTDYIGLAYKECETLNFIYNDGGTDSVTVLDCFDYPAYDITINSDNTINFIAYDNTAGITDSVFSFRVYNADDSLDIEDNTEMEIQIPTEPDIYTYTAEDVDTNSAKLRGQVTLNDYEDVRVYFQYREKGTSTWSESTYVTLSGSYTFSEVIEGLDSDTTYEYRSKWENLDFSSYYSTAGIVEFTTSAGASPTIANVNPTSITETSATLRGIADFDGYSGNLYGALGYSTESDGTYDLPDTPYQQISDTEIFTRDISGLSAGTGYYYKAFLFDADTGGTALDFSETDYFETDSSGGASSGDLSVSHYWNFDESSGNLIDQVGSVDGSNTGIVYQQTAVAPNSDYSYDYDGGSSGDTTDLGTTLSYPGDSDWSIDG